MNAMNSYVNEYQKNQLETATPEEILILLYNAAINFLNKAKVSLGEKDYELYEKNVNNCKNIIQEFMNSLDMEHGGNVAVTLNSLYRYYNKVLVKAMASKKVDGVDEVLTHLTNLRETWQKAIEISKSEKSTSSIDKYVPINITDDADEYEEDDSEYEDPDDEDEE